MEKKEKCIVDEINLNQNQTAKKNTQIPKNNKMNKSKKIMERKKVTSNLNLKLSAFIFIVMCILALYIILHKGVFGDYSLIKSNDFIHTAELECENYFLSILDSESTEVDLTIDGMQITGGFELRSSDENIAKIDGDKVVAGEKEGTATITAYYKDYDMTIATDILTYIPINTITATATANTIKEGQESEININIIPKDGTDDYITYTSSDPSIATVDENGVVIGVSAGTVTINIKDEITGAGTTKDITVK